MFVDALIISLLFLIFAIPHSVMASVGFKNRLINAIGDKIAFYRMFYIISSIVIFLFIYVVSPKPQIKIYDLTFPFDIIIVVLQIISGIILLWVTKFINISEFLGIAQILRYMKNEYKVEDSDEKMELRIDGPFKYSRHPIYLFSSLFLILRPTMDFFYLVFLINMILYFYIGAYFEEKKLVRIFGEDYKNYQKNVPKIFPNIKSLLKRE